MSDAVICSHYAVPFKICSSRQPIKDNQKDGTNSKSCPPNWTLVDP